MNILGMNTSRLLLLFAVVFLSGCATTPSVEGTYRGKVFSGSVTDMLTTFYPQPLDNEKLMYGLFMYKEGEGWVAGSISRCKLLPERKLKCQWHDKYGSGIMDVTFDEQYESFDGLWGTYCGTRPHLIWNGKRVKESPEVN